MPFGYAERVTLSEDSLAECWRWLQRPGGRVGSVRHVLTKQESRQQEAGTQVPPQVGLMATALSGSSPSRNSKGGEEANFFPGNQPQKPCKDGRTVRKLVPPVSYLTWLHRLLGSLTLQVTIKPDSVLWGPSFPLSWLSCLTENWKRDGIKYTCLGCHISI